MNLLYRAILADSADDVKHAIDAGAKPNDKEFYRSGEKLRPLGWAILFAKSKAAEALLEYGARTESLGKHKKLNADLFKPIEYALSMGDIKTSLALLKHTKDK